jgi:hypothetical protein
MPVPGKHRDDADMLTKGPPGMQVRGSTLIVDLLNKHAIGVYYSKTGTSTSEFGVVIQRYENKYSKSTEVPPTLAYFVFVGLRHTSYRPRKPQNKSYVIRHTTCHSCHPQHTGIHLTSMHPCTRRSPLCHTFLVQ